jgi:hypothetical protein
LRLSFGRGTVLGACPGSSFSAFFLIVSATAALLHSRRRKAGVQRAKNASLRTLKRFSGLSKHTGRPQHREDRDIFERLYAVRLDRMRA